MVHCRCTLATGCQAIEGDLYPPLMSLYRRRLPSAWHVHGRKVGFPSSPASFYVPCLRCCAPGRPGCNTEWLMRQPPHLSSICCSVAKPGRGCNLLLGSLGETMATLCGKHRAPSSTIGETSCFTSRCIVNHFQLCVHCMHARTNACTRARVSTHTNSVRVLFTLFVQDLMP